jgi:uncharacterized protein
MNRPAFLHIVERLEGFVGRLPETIQKPILRELTPLKELFLQQRPPRFAFTGSTKHAVQEIIQMLFAVPEQLQGDAIIESHQWHDVHLSDRGTISLLDMRNAETSGSLGVRRELSRQPPDVIFFIEEEEKPRGSGKMQTQSLANLLEETDANAKIIVITFGAQKRATARNDGEAAGSSLSHLRSDFELKPDDRFLRAFSFPPNDPQELMSILAREVPNEARIEMIRIARDREAQREVAQILVKSTAAVCTAIGAQPIPLADLPILTTLQLVMVSGIMYVSGRERSLRAATEFIGALGANVGIGMLFREGTRALLKFFPGWGNVICGMVAGAGTYAIGRAAIVFFLEGVSLKDARRVYLRSRKRPERPALPAPRATRKPLKRLKQRSIDP